MPLARLATRTTTVRIPLPLYDQARCLLETERRGNSASVSLNDLIVTAITAYLNMHRRKQIDSSFAGMAEDADYQGEAALLSEEFEYTDWEALRLEEEDVAGELAYASSSAR